MTSAKLSRGVGLQDIIDQIRAHSSANGAGQDYKKIPDLLDSLRQDVQAAIDRDWAEYNSADTTAMKRFLEYLLFIGTNEEQFQKQATAWCSEAWTSLHGVEQVCQQAKDSLDVPERLFADARTWEKIAQEAKTLSQEIPRMAQIEGWSGPAAEQYAVMTGVQAQACVEYRGIPGVIWKNTLLFAELNEAVLQDVAGMLTSTHGYNVRDINIQVADGLQFFKRTQKVKANLDELMGSVLACHHIVAGPMRGAYHRYAESLNGAVLLKEGGWPSGVSQAGVPAGDTSASKVNIDNRFLEISVEEGGDVAGIRR